VSTALYVLHRVDAPHDQEVARSTTEAVDESAPAAVERDAPEFNEVERDTTQHAGMRPSNLASHFVPSTQYAPRWAQNAQVTPSFAGINERQAVVGTAAGREMGGQFGHGTMSYAIGLEPTIREGGAFGNDYFTADHPGIQPSMGYYMEMAPGYDKDISAAASAQAKVDAHQAVADGYVSVWSGAMMPGARHG
jgi:hypothetical protein